MNKVILQGRLTKDVELKYTQSSNSTAYAKFSIAVQRRIKREGEPDADFFNCVAFGKTGEKINEHFHKGRLILLEGHIQCGSYTNKDGNKVYTTDIVVENFDFTGEKKQEQGGASSSDFVSDEEVDEDLPF